MIQESMELKLTPLQKRTIVALVNGEPVKWPGTLKKSMIRKGLITPLQKPTPAGLRIAAKLKRIGEQE
jgi:hypothetical protein